MNTNAISHCGIVLGDDSANCIIKYIMKTMRSISHTIFIALFVIGFCNLSYAYNWQKILESGDAQIYWDLEHKLKKNDRGNYLLWTMTSLDFISDDLLAKGQYVQSMIEYKEIDCSLRRTRTIYVEMYTEKMANGKLVHRLDFEKMPPTMKVWEFGRRNAPRVKYLLGICDRKNK